MGYTDDKILAAIRHGNNREAIALFYKDFWLDIYHYVSKNSGNYEDVKEVYHHGILKFLESVKKNKYDKEKGEIKGFIFTICKNHWIDVMKKRKKERNISEIYRREAPNSVITDTTTTEARDFIKQLFLELGDKCSHILNHFFYDSLSMKDIAEKMKLKNPDAAKVQKYKCVVKLRTLLKDNPKTKKVVLELLRTQ